MLRQSVAIAAVVVLASTGPAVAAKRHTIDPAALPQGAPATIAYHADGTGIVTPSGTIATPLTTTSLSAGPVDGRYVVYKPRSTDPATGAVGTLFYLVDQAGTATRVGGTYSQLDHGETKIGGGFAAMRLDYTTTTDAPLALLNLRTGQEFRYENAAYDAVTLFQPGPDGVPFAARTPGKPGSYRTVTQWAADGSMHRLFRLPKHRAAAYVDTAHNLVVSTGRHGRALFSTVRTPAKVRWSTGPATVQAISPSGKRVLLRQGHGKVYELRKLSNGKLLHRYRFVLNQFGAAAFEDNDTFLTGARSSDNQPDVLIRCRRSGGCEKVAGPGYYFGFNN